MIYFLVAILGLLAVSTDSHILPQKVNNPVAFILLRIFFFSLAGAVLGFLGFFIKITGFPGGVIFLIFGIIFLLFSISHIPIFPRIVVLGLRNHHHSAKTLHSAFTSILSSSFTLQIVIAIALINGFYFESAYILGFFALSTSMWVFNIKIPVNRVSKIFQIILFIVSSLFMISRGLLYSSLYHFSPFESFKIARVPEVLAEKQFFKTNLNNIDDRQLIGDMHLVWLLEGKGNTIYIPAYKHKSKLVNDTDQLELSPANKSLIYFTLGLGRGNYILKIHDNITDYFNLPYARVIDSGYGEHFRVENPISNPQVKVSSMALPIIEDGEQDIVIEINSSGFYPSVIVLQEGIPATINFKLTEITENNKKAIIPSYNTQIDFKLGDNPIIISEPLFDFIFYSYFGDFGGFVLISDDAESMTLETVQRRVRMLNMDGL